ncbi:MAG: hypothetical protein R2710_24870 [Acidimicrobiales bacterium]
MTRHPTLIHERVDAARRGENPTVICRMPSGWAVLGDHQFLLGYSLLLPDPVVDHLTDLDHAGRAQYLTDMARIGDALHACTDTFRVNYEILGNGDAALHAHIFPRHLTEPDQYRRAPVWAYPTETRTGSLFDPDIHGELQRRLAAYITGVGL